MKFAEKIFPKGTFKGQQTDGAYINKTLAANLDILARKINKDMHFLGIITGHDGVGNGKTTMATQVCSYLTNKINEIHGTNNSFSDKDVYFRAIDLIRDSQNSPKLSLKLLDEGDDLTTHSMKELSRNLRRYFRKCRQLNQIVILILPSFFELPKFYALNRSHFLIDVYFKGEYDRGFFNFYGPKDKKLLYLKGKKEWDYDAHRCGFPGRFFSEYCFLPDLEESTKSYLKKKHADLADNEDEDLLTPKELIRQHTIKLFKQVHVALPNVYIRELAEAFGISQRTGQRWLREWGPEPCDEERTYINNTIKGEKMMDEASHGTFEQTPILIGEQRA